MRQAWWGAAPTALVIAFLGACSGADVAPSADPRDAGDDGRANDAAEAGARTPALEDGGGDAAEDGPRLPDASPPIGIIFAADFSASRFPLYGFDSEAVTPGHSTRRAVAGAGPNGQDVAEYALTINASPAQPYLGWKKNNLPQTNQGDTRYIRLLMKVLAPCNPGGGFDVWADKLIILGDGSGGFSRVIGVFGDPSMPYPPGNSARIRLGALSKNIGGFPQEACAAQDVTVGAWHWVQWELASSSTTTANDARIKLWMDQASYDAPTSQSNPMNLRTGVYTDAGQLVDPNGWNNINLGFFAGTNLASGALAFQFAAFQLADAFDPSWHP